MKSIYIQNLMKDQGSLELAMEIQKKQRRLTIFTSLILAYPTVVTNDLRIDGKVF